MTRKLVPVVVVVLVALGLAALPSPVLAQAQAAGGAIEGTVTDQSGGVLPGVTVSDPQHGDGRDARDDHRRHRALPRARCFPSGPTR